MVDVMKNAIMARLDAAARKRILGEATEIDLPLQKSLIDAGGVIDFVYFPTEGVISIVSLSASGDMIEVAVVGREGFTGINVLLGGDVSPCGQIVQMGGSGFAIAREPFRRLIAEEDAFRELLLRHCQAFVFQLMMSVVCNGSHSAEQRLARWLLAMHERGVKGRINLTQEFLADMLNVRRATVSEALRRLHDAGAIVAERARVTIMDVGKLEAAACECHGLVRSYRRRVMAR